MDHEGLDTKEPELKENLPSEQQRYPNSIVDDLYNQLEVWKDDCEFKNIVDHYFKDVVYVLEGEECW